MGANRRGLEELCREIAPGAQIEVIRSEAFASTNIRVTFSSTAQKLVSDAEAGRDLEAYSTAAMVAMADAQKEAIVALGLESYVREREILVLERIKEQYSGSLPDGGFGLEAVKSDLSGE